MGILTPRAITMPRTTMQTQLAPEALQRELGNRLHRFVMRMRFVVAPLPLVLGGFVLALDPTLWRRLALGGVLTVAVLLSFVEDARVRRQPSRSRRPPLPTIVGVQSVVMIATGGVVSPLVLAMLVVAFVASTLLPRRDALVLVACEVFVIWLAAALDLLGWLGPLLPLPFRSSEGGLAPTFIFALVLVESTVFLITRQLGWTIQQSFHELLIRAIHDRDESLRLNQERLTDLTQLSGEIAHELKNPLTSVKGLAALLARRATAEIAEPLAVLRREVDRMQSVLEEFLNFSRPVVPLNLEGTDLYHLAADVLALHNGLLDARRLHADLVGDSPTWVDCDPRKIRQVLINLLQNAIEASPAGQSIQVTIERSTPSSHVAIADSGPGLDPVLAARVFDAGVTSKPRGSGLGLSVARGLARQHGGNVTLESGPAGGCVARLTLPAEPVTESASGRGTRFEPTGEQA